MGETLIQIVQAAATELGLPVPAQAVLAQDNTGRQMAGLANRCGRLLIRMHNWTALTQEWHITIPAPILVPSLGLTQGNPVITVPVGLTAQLSPTRMTVSGTGIMTATRLIAVSAANNTVTLDQPPTITGTADLTFSYDTPAEPPDWERGINRTQWDRTMRWEMRGPQSPQSDQWVRSGIVATGPRRMYRPIGGSFRIWPSPAATDAGSQLVSEYISSNWVLDAGGNPKIRFTADADTCVFPDDVMVTGLKYLFFATKGFETSALYKMWHEATQVAIATDGPSPTLDMDRTRFPIFLSPSNVQDADFPGSFGNR